MQFERARKNTGWCPNTPTVRTAPVILVSDPAADYSLDPAGGAGGSERIYRGAHIAMGSFKTLMDNKKLLWFSFLAGMVMVFLFTAEFFLHVLGTYPYPAIAYPATLVLIFGVELITILCINFLLAGLIVKLSPALSDRRETIREGISRVRSIAVWSAILAFAGTALIAVMDQFAGNLSTAIYMGVTRFPFSFVLESSLRGPGPIGGAFHASYAATSAIFAMIVNLVVLGLTLFVIPVLVLERKRLTGALAESATLLKKSWVEILSCFVIFALGFLAFSLASYIFLPVFVAVSLNGPFWSEFWYKGGWIAVGAAYMIAWSILAFIGSTAAGIAVMDLYSYGKTGRMPGSIVGSFP